MKKDEGFEIWLDEEEGWKLKSTQHSIDVIRESEAGHTKVRKYTGSIKRALNTYINERTKRIDAKNVDELKNEITKLDEHLSTVVKKLKEEEKE